MSPALFTLRAEQEERMEDPGTSAAEFIRALEDIRWVNRYLGGTDIALATLQNMIRAYPEQTHWRLLDLGTGAGDIPLALYQWGQQHGVSLSITAVDCHPVAVDYARNLTAHIPDISVWQADALQLGCEDGSFDIAFSSMFMHHLSNDGAVRLLQEMDRLSCRGFFISDLERHPMAYWGIKTLGWLLSKGSVFRHDAPLSVRRGFNREELGRLLIESGLRQVNIRPCWPYRWVICKTHGVPDE